MLTEYRHYLNSIPYEALLVEAVNVWGIDDAESMDKDELIEILVGRDDAIDLAGAL